MNRPMRGPRVTSDDVEAAILVLWQQSRKNAEAAGAVNDIRLFVSGDQSAGVVPRPLPPR